ncbi:hypothetical protein CTAYLR_001375 [Chrysophaeum taylorii]|uniref:Uncharacterized protein n=1 Tax=Chrysophaeum taylorii TaxID=2483200 RepID=A0AAD7U5A3_9STRA|nr:hypothetical protein CTAYLR_001375 [Chrysophaeum taylorii]
MLILFFWWWWWSAECRVLEQTSLCSSGVSRRRVAPRRIRLVSTVKTSVRVVNIGLGTTATHLSYAVACRARIPSCHFFVCCHVGKAAKAAHGRAVQWFWRWVRCVRERTCGSRVVGELREALGDVLSSGVQSLHDSPYAFLATEFAALGVRFVQTRRQSREWVERRRTQVPFLPDPVCRAPASGGSFDFMDCVAARGNNVSDAFELSTAVADLEARFVAHQTYVASLVDEADLFQLCAWDEDVQTHLLDAAAFMKAASSAESDIRRATTAESGLEQAENLARSGRASAFRFGTVPKGPRVNFAPGEFRAAARHLFFDRKHKIVLCAIPKVACTELIKLVYRLSGDGAWRSEPHFRNDAPTLDKLGMREASAVMNDPTWTKVVFLRDPLTRLLSAFLDKFVESPRRGLHSNYGIRLFGRRMDFRRFVEAVASNQTRRDEPYGLHLGTNAHWKPQRFSCSLEKFAHHFHFVGRYENLREHSESLLRALGLWEDVGKTGWAPPVPNISRPHRDSLFARAAAHRTGSDRRLEDYYTPDLERMARQAYAMDYDFLDALGADDPSAPPVSGADWGPRRRLLCGLVDDGTTPFGPYCTTTVEEEEGDSQS